MMTRKVSVVALLAAAVLGLSVCDDANADQDGPLSFGAPDGDIENTSCGLTGQRNGVADVASNISDDLLWITAVEAVEAKHWDTVRPSVSLIDSGDSSLIGWNNADLDSVDVRRAVDNLVALDDPFEVQPGQSVQVALEGVVAASADNAEVSQLRIRYTTDLNSAKSSAVLGNIRYTLKADTCD